MQEESKEKRALEDAAKGASKKPQSLDDKANYEEFSGDRAQAFGQMLRKTWEDKGLSKRDLAHLTRISPPFIDALECGDFEKLPGHVFGRGFVRNICGALKVPSAPLLAELEAAWPGAHEHQAAKKKKKAPTKSAMTGERESEQFFGGLTNRRVLSIGLSLLFIAVVGSISRYQASERAETAQVSNEESEDVVPPAENGEGGTKDPETLESSDKTAEGHVAEVAPVTETPAVAVAVPAPQPPEGLSINLHVRENVIVKHSADGAEMKEQEFTPGKHNLAFKEKLEVVLLDANKLDVEFRGEMMTKLGALDKEKKMSFFAGSPPQLKISSSTNASAGRL